MSLGKTESRAGLQETGNESNKQDRLKRFD